MEKLGFFSGHSSRLSRILQTVILSTSSYKDTRRLFWIGFTIILGWSAIPGLFPDTGFLIHDNLDSNVVWALDLVNHSSWFAAWDSDVHAAMGGIKRYCYPSEFHLFYLLISIFGAKSGYLINYTLLHLVAYVGVFLLSEKISGNNIFGLCLALGFAFIPFWPPGSLSVAGLPLLIFCTHEIVFNRRFLLINIGGCVLVLLGSLFFFSTFWLCLVSIFFFTALLGTRIISRLNFYQLTIFSMGFGFVNALMDWRLIVSQILGQQLHRHQWENTVNQALNYKGVIGEGLKQILEEGVAQIFYGHYHMWVGFFSAVIASLAFVFFGQWNKVAFLVLGFVLLCSCLSVVKDVELGHRIATYLPIHQINPRCNAIIPGQLVVLASFSFSAIKSKGIRVALFAVMLFNGFTSALGLTRFNTDLKGSHYAENLFASAFFFKKTSTHKTWDDYYLTEDFKRLKATGVSANATIACVNFQPEKARYNGFKTIGCYLNCIDLESYNFLRTRFTTESNQLLSEYDSRAYFHPRLEEVLVKIPVLREMDVSLIAVRKKDGNIEGWLNSLGQLKKLETENLVFFHLEQPEVE